MVDNKVEKDVNLLELARKLWDNKKFIIKVTLVGVVVGLIIAFSIPKTYTSTIVFTVDSNKSASGNMNTLASLAGISIGGLSSSDVFSPDIYPSIMSSTSFLKGLFNVRVEDPKCELDTTLYVYLKDGQEVAWWSYVFGLPKKISKLFSSNDVETSSIVDQSKYFITEEDRGVIGQIKESFLIITDKKTGITSIEVTSQNPVVSAFLADTLTSYLQSYVIAERTRKANTDLVNSEKLLAQAKDTYDAIQKDLASFIDRNKNITSAQYKIKQDKLESEKTLAFSVYTQMAQQVQINKIKVQDDTPVFTIIQPAIEPIYPSGPKKKIIFVVFVFLGVMAASCWVVKKNILDMFMRKE